MHDDNPYKPPLTPPAQEEVSRVPEWLFDTAMAGLALVVIIPLSARLAWIQFIQQRPFPPAIWGLVAGFAGLGALYCLSVCRRHWLR